MGNCFSCFSEEVDGQIGHGRPLLRGGPRFESYTDSPGAPTDKKWYHAAISDNEAERRLKFAGSNNSYLVYNNTRKSGQYVLLVLNGGEMYRWNISQRQSDGKYILGNDGPGVEGFSTVRDLIKAHRGILGKPIKTDSGKTLTLSRGYVYYDPSRF